MKKLIVTIVFVLLSCFVPFFVVGCSSESQSKPKNITSVSIASGTYTVYEVGETIDLVNTFVKINYTQNGNSYTTTVSLDKKIPNLNIAITGIKRNLSDEFFPFGLGKTQVEIFVEGLLAYGETGIIGSASASFEILVVDDFDLVDITGVAQTYIVGEQFDDSSIVANKIDRYGNLISSFSQTVTVDGFDTSKPCVKKEMTITANGISKVLSYSVLPSADYVVDTHLPVNFILPKSYVYCKAESNYAVYKNNGNLVFDAITMDIGKTAIQFELCDWLQITELAEGDVTSFAKSTTNGINIATIKHQYGVADMREVVAWTNDGDVTWFCFYFSYGADEALFDLVISSMIIV